MQMDVNDYDKVKKKIGEINKKEAELQVELSQIEDEQKKYIKELAMLESQTEKQLEEINLAKKEESTVNEEEIHKKCKEAIDYFLQDIAADQQFGFSLPIRIEYQQMKIFKNIVDENITFEKLKEETKNQFGKEFDEFFFADENGHIFLDGQRVTPALFPLSNVKVDKYEPVIYVVNKISYKNNQVKDTAKDLVDFAKKKEPKKNWKKVFSQYLKKNSIRVYFTLFIILFTGLYSQSCINNRQAKEYRAIQVALNPFIQKLNLDINDKIKPDKINSSIQNLLNKQNDYLPTNHLTMFDHMTIIQKHNIQKCSSERLGVDNSECKNIYQINKASTSDYNYTSNPSYQSIKGKYNNYDNDGDTINYVGSSIPDSLITANTATIILLFTLYSPNYHTLISLRFLVETQTSPFTNSYDILISNLNQSVDGYLVACIIISIVLLILLFFIIKQNKEVEVKDPPNPNSCCLEARICCFSCCKSFQTHFRCPTFIECFSFLNILFFYGVIIFRHTFLSTYTVPLSLSDNVDVQNIANKYELVTVSSCFNLLFFYVIIVGFMSNYLDEFQTITTAINAYFRKIFSFVILYILPFILISMFISYQMFGDNYMSYYRELLFAFLKVLQSFSRGSLDHIDYPDADMHRTREAYSRWALSRNDYKYLMEGSGVAGYILFSLLYFLVCWIIIRGFVIGQFYFFYRNRYIQKLIDEAKQKKEEKLAERIQIRNEERKLEEKERKIKEEGTEEKEDEIKINTMTPIE